MNKRVAFAVIFIFQIFATLSGWSQSASTTLGDGVIVYDLALRKNLLGASLGDLIQIWDYKRKVLLKSWSAKKILAIEFHDELLAGVSKEGTAFVWDVSTGKEMMNAKISNSPLTCVVWIDSVSFAAGSDSGEITKFNVVTGQVNPLIKIAGPVTTLTGTPDGKLMVSGDSKGNIAIWNADTGVQVTIIRGHRGWVRDLRISNRFLISAGDDGSVKQWSMDGLGLVSKTSFGSWALCVDYYKPDPKKRAIQAIGLRNGKVRIVTGFGNYKFKAKSMVNNIVLFTDELPNVLFAIGTHGEGIKLIDATFLKMGK